MRTQTIESARGRGKQRKASATGESAVAETLADTSRQEKKVTPGSVFFLTWHGAPEYRRSGQFDQIAPWSQRHSIPHSLRHTDFLNDGYRNAHLFYKTKKDIDRETKRRESKPQVWSQSVSICPRQIPFYCSKKSDKKGTFDL
ncbi:hypothetical protein SDC9_129752 [bioreactor metagenome]|uniref:Uncharacterized protein n=1 Tax=bioreactor metagenome TaxID=1076179 RepID=A0A645CZP8_9ZZZZ